MWNMKNKLNSVSFTINGKIYRVGENISYNTSLNTYIRTHLGLKGTKFMCLEGGCGVCLVTVKGIHPVSKKERIWSVNSCLTPIFSCHGLDIITIEGIGNRRIGYHPIQTRLSEFNGTQCGYCSPGMVINMYSLMESKGNSVSMEEIENSFGGNICRCTGYRPILDAFKSLASDADQKLLDLCNDIEDLNKICPKSGQKCSGSCHLNPSNNMSIKFPAKQEWHKVFKLEDLFSVVKTIDSRSYMLVAGNTAHGVYRRDPNLEVFIDINAISELRSHSIGTELIIGGNVNLTETMDILMEAAQKNGFEYCKHLHKHIDLIANVPVRNSGTIAGNLSIKYAHHEFPSDMFIILEGIGAKITIMENETQKSTLSMQDYLKFDMKKKLILNITLPSLDPNVYAFRSYKIMPRAQNAHAYVNAAFLMEKRDGVIGSIRICFGGITPQFIHAENTEKLLIGKDLYNNDVMQNAFKSLNAEMNPDWILPDASPEYRKMLAISLFYKFIISTAPLDKIRPEIKSGGEILERPVSSGTQTFDTYKDKWPLTQPVQKYEGLIQTSGEASYANDLPNYPNELWAAFVPAKRANGKISKIVPTEALKISGVYSFYSAKNIPGKNSFTPVSIFSSDDEEIFVDREILFYGQPVGIILADTMDLANYAATKVEVIYENEEKITPMLSIKDILERNATDRIFELPYKLEATQYGTNIAHNISGNLQMGLQYHYTLEPQTTICVPSDEENGIDVYASTQWIDYTQIAIANCIDIPQNKVNMTVKRLGGAYGAKISRNTQIACACALACHLTNRPIRFVMTIESNMTVIGKRFPSMGEYNVDVDNNGKIQKLLNRFTVDGGCSQNDDVSFLIPRIIHNCYGKDNIDLTGQIVLTNTPSNTFCRAPGVTETIAMIENIMEHIARVVNRDPVDVRMENIPNNHIMKTLLPDFLKQIDYEPRKNEIEKFNNQNRWRKRGIAVIPMEYYQQYLGNYAACVVIYHGDGTVAITHGGIECGQGINTKAAQVAAYTLGIPLKYISVKATNNLIGANALATCASFTSESVCYAVRKSCEEILDRIKPIRDTLPNDVEWLELIQVCHSKLIDLSGKYMYKAGDATEYLLWGISCAEIEIDLLTGNIQLKRVDIVEDTGESLSPNVDVGQIEGAFIMGIGYWLTENLVYNRENGELLTNRTWTYKPPGVKDIPIDFRVSFLRKNSNQFGILRSKTTGEPPLCMSIVVIFALRYALDSARKDAGLLSNHWYHLGAPSTPEVIFLKSGITIEAYKL